MKLSKKVLLSLIAIQGITPIIYSGSGKFWGAALGGGFAGYLIGRGQGRRESQRTYYTQPATQVREVRYVEAPRQNQQQQRTDAQLKAQLREERAYSQKLEKRMESLEREMQSLKTQKTTQQK